MRQRRHTDVLVRFTVEVKVLREGLREAMLAAEAGAQRLVMATEQFSQSVEDLRFLRLPLDREHVS